MGFFVLVFLCNFGEVLLRLEFTHRAAADRGDVELRGQCEAEHTERREIFLDCCSIIRQKKNGETYSLLPHFCSLSKCFTSKER